MSLDISRTPAILKWTPRPTKCLPITLHQLWHVAIVSPRTLTFHGKLGRVSLDENAMLERIMYHWIARVVIEAQFDVRASVGRI